MCTFITKREWGINLFIVNPFKDIVWTTVAYIVFHRLTLWLCDCTLLIKCLKQEFARSSEDRTLTRRAQVGFNQRDEERNTLMWIMKTLKLKKGKKRKKRGQSTDLLSGTILAKQCPSSSNTPGSPCSRSLQTSPFLSSCLPSSSSSPSPSSSPHHPHSRIVDIVYQELLPDKSCNIVDIGAHGGDTTLPLALVARFSREQCWFIMTSVPEVGR